MLPQIDTAFYPTPQEVLNQILSDLRYGYAQVGIVANVEPGGDHWFRAKAIANRISIALANNQIAIADFSPLTATGEDLTTLASVFGVFPRPAAGSAGVANIESLGLVAIPDGFFCTAPNGEQYKTITFNNVSNGDPVQISAVGTGTATNQAPGTILTWDDASIGNLKQTLTVDSDGLDGGVASDDEETLRSRLLRRLAYPSVGGNWAQVASLAEESTASVERAYVYTAVRGPGSYDVAVTKAGGDRNLPLATVSVVASHIAGALHGNMDLNVTSVEAQEVDVILSMALPLPASVGGAGGGWRDAVPWPSTADIPLAKVTSGPTLNTITVNSTSADPPVAGKRFGIWDPEEGRMLEFTIAIVTGVSGAYVIEVDAATSDAISGVQLGAYLSAGAFNITAYATDYLAAINQLGPGEKTDSQDIIPRGRRQPGPDVENPVALTTLQLSALTSQHTEILDLNYAGRFDTGTSTPRLTPGLPLTTAEPPKILVLKHLAFRRQV